jgi:acyl-CoA thioester hydrolase
LGVKNSQPMERKLPSQLTLRIDWSELDYFGHVNNVMFYKYVQASRVHYWDSLGLTEFHREHNIGPMLASCKCDFRKPLFYPGQVKISAGLAFVKNTSFGLIHEIRNERGELAAEASDVMVMYDFNEDHKVPIPDWMRDAMARMD